MNPKKNSKPEKIAKDGSSVTSYMKTLGHPMQKEIEAIRKIILGANKKISERMKSNAPSYFYKEEIGAFNPKAMSSVQFVIQFPKGIPKGDYGDLLEGSFKDKRIMMFSDMEDIKGKKSALIKVMNDWCELVG